MVPPLSNRSQLDRRHPRSSNLCLPATFTLLSRRWSSCARDKSPDFSLLRRDPFLTWIWMSGANSNCWRSWQGIIGSCLFQPSQVPSGAITRRMPHLQSQMPPSCSACWLICAPKHIIEIGCGFLPRNVGYLRCAGSRHPFYFHRAVSPTY